MKAAILKEIGKPLAVEDRPAPRCAPDEVLVATRTCGICRTDLHIQDGLAYVPALPHIPGHEPAGVVAEVGSLVRDIKPGERVTAHLFVSRRECQFTRSGQHAQAMHTEGILGVTLPGGFAEFFTLPAANVLPLPENVPFDLGGLTSCAVITAVHAYRKSGLQVNDTALVVGAGGIGLILIQLLAAAGARVIAISRSPDSRKLAIEAGAIESLSPQAPGAAERVRATCGKSGDGCDVVFEMVGTSQTMSLAARCVRRGGRIVVIGEEPEFPAIDTITIAQREIEIVGSRNGGKQDALDALELMASGVIRPVIAGRFPLEGINEALSLVRGGQTHGRVIIDVSEG